MMVKSTDACTTTGFAAQHLPPGPECDLILCHLRQAWEFASQRTGRRPGPLTREVLQIVRQPGALNSFEWLLEQLEDAALRPASMAPASCVLKVNRARQTLDYYDQPAGRTFQVTFKRIQNILSDCKKKCAPKFPCTP